MGGYPSIIHFSGFSFINHPAIGVPPWLWKPTKLARLSFSYRSKPLVAVVDLLLDAGGVESKQKSLGMRPCI